MKMYRSTIVGLLILSLLVMAGCQPSQQRDTTTPQPETQPAEVTVDKPAVEVTEPEPVVAADGPVVKVENPVHDFGEMGPNASDKCEYKFTNAGNATLKIDRIQSTCGCTVPQLEKKTYEPGESGVIKVTFRAPSVKGKVNKHLYIISNDPKNPRFELGIKANVVVKVSIAPESVELRLDKENAGMPDIVVKSLDDREFSITSVIVGRQAIKVPFDRKEKAKEFTLKPVVDKKMLNEFNNGIIQVKTDHPRAGTLSVRYEVIPWYTVQRDRIILQNVQPGVAIIKDNFIRSNYGKTVEIASVTSRNNYMEIESQERDGEHLKFKIRITPPERNETSRRYITDEMTITLKDGTKLKVRSSGWYKLR